MWIIFGGILGFVIVSLHEGLTDDESNRQSQKKKCVDVFLFLLIYLFVF